MCEEHDNDMITTCYILYIYPWVIPWDFLLTVKVYSTHSPTQQGCGLLVYMLYLQPIGRMVGTYGSEGTSLLDRSTPPGVDPATQQS